MIGSMLGQRRRLWTSIKSAAAVASRFLGNDMLLM